MYVQSTRRTQGENRLCGDHSSGCHSHRMCRQTYYPARDEVPALANSFVQCPKGIGSRQDHKAKGCRQGHQTRAQSVNHTPCCAQGTRSAEWNPQICPVSVGDLLGELKRGEAVHMGGLPGFPGFPGFVAPAPPLTGVPRRRPAVKRKRKGGVRRLKGSKH